MTGIKFKASVRFAQKQQTYVVLDTAAPGPSLKLALEAGPLLAALGKGTDRSLERREKVCVRELRRYGFLEDSVMDPAIAARTHAGVVYLGNPDRFAAVMARLLLAVPAAALTAILAVAIVLAAATVGYQYWLWLSGQVKFEFSWLGVVA